jgi:alginate O-acetyltransferase complex protein AlgI
MLFDSPIYICFLVLVVVIYWRLPWRKQNYMLLAASYFFYGWWDWRFLLLMLASTTLDYLIGLQIAKSDNHTKRRALLIFSLVLNFGFLGFFKYFNFFIDSFSGAAQMLGFHNIPLPLLRIILPPGISFYTFQEVAYIVDVYNRKLEPASNIFDYALFISLFPHLIAGPIQRPSHLLPQVQHPRKFDENKVFDGIMLILFGLFRKCVIADNCALLANAAFNGTLGPPNLAIVLLGSYAFAWQIYGDFSGYSDIARGSAQLMGFHFMVNFRQPYLADSLQSFWRRWHISLSTWLRDYLYIALGGNAKGRVRTYSNLLTTMLLGGLWHGANWTFVVWGAIHGLWLAIERFLKETFGRTSNKRDTSSTGAMLWVKRIALFQLVCVTWIFFRAQSVREAWHFLKGITVWSWSPQYWIALKFLAVFSLPLFLLDLVLETRDEEYAFEKSAPSYRLAWGTAILILITFFSANQASAFIYFQF